MFRTVHSLNVLRSLLLDARLSERVLQHVESAVHVAISLFASLLWTIRNAAAQLFAALVLRIFGVPHTTDYRSMRASRKNCQTALEFFGRYD